MRLVLLLISQDGSPHRDVHVQHSTGGVDRLSHFSLAKSDNQCNGGNTQNLAYKRCRMKRKEKLHRNVEVKYVTVAPCRVDNVTQTELKQKE